MVVVICFWFKTFVRASIISFFKTYDALCEKGTATLVCSALDGIADITIPGRIILTGHCYLIAAPN